MKLLPEPTHREQVALFRRFDRSARRSHLLVVRVVR